MIRKVVASLVLSLCLVCFIGIGTAQAAAAPQKIGIVDFDNKCRSRFADRANVAAGKVAAYLVKPKTMEIVPPDAMAAALAAKGFAPKGILDTATAAAAGKLLGLDYVVTGSVQQVSYDATEGYWKTEKYGGKTWVAPTAESIVKIEVSIVEVKTGQRVFSKLFERAGGGDVERTIAEASYLIASKIYTKYGPIQGVVTKVEKNKVYLNIGTDCGVAIEDRFFPLQTDEEELAEERANSSFWNMITLNIQYPMLLKVIEVTDKQCVAEIKHPKKNKVVAPGVVFNLQLK